MKIERKSFLELLTVLLPGTADAETFHQSDCFIFTGQKIHTFNGDIAMECAHQTDWSAAVPAKAIIDVLSKLTDTELECSVVDGELRIKGERKTAGIKIQTDIEFPMSELPKFGKFRSIPEEMFVRLKQAAKICGRDDSAPRTTHVHITEKFIEATDGFRLFRAALELPIKNSLLVPASSISACRILKAPSICVMEGWLHIKTEAGVICSIRCAEMEYFSAGDLEKLLTVKGSKLNLPQNLPEILKRASSMETAGESHITLKENLLILRTENESGWYSEKKKIKYTGEPLRFTVNPQFLRDILQHSHEVMLGNGKIKIHEDDHTQFVVALEMGE